MPVEIMLLPRWFPFHLSKVSYWSRTVIAPLLVVMDRKPRAANPRGVSIRELFRDDPARETYNMNASGRSEEHTSELQSLMRISYAVFCLKKQKKQYNTN